MSDLEPFSFMLTGGHPNSLGRTEEVVSAVHADRSRMDELFDCYRSSDEVVRLRTSSALKRLFRAEPRWLDTHSERLFADMATLDQPSAKWTFAQLALDLRKQLSAADMARAKDIVVKNLHEDDDWIVLNMSMKTCAHWVRSDPDLASRLRARALELSADRRRSVANGAAKLLRAMGEAL